MIVWSKAYRTVSEDRLRYGERMTEIEGRSKKTAESPAAPVKTDSETVTGEETRSSGHECENE